MGTCTCNTNKAESIHREIPARVPIAPPAIMEGARLHYRCLCKYSLGVIADSALVPTGMWSNIPSVRVRTALFESYIHLSVDAVTHLSGGCDRCQGSVTCQERSVLSPNSPTKPVPGPPRLSLTFTVTFLKFYPSGLSAELCQPCLIALTAPLKISALLDVPFNIESGYVRPAILGFLS